MSIGGWGEDGETDVLPLQKTLISVEKEKKNEMKTTYGVSTDGNVDEWRYSKTDSTFLTSFKSAP